MNRALLLLTLSFSATACNLKDAWSPDEGYYDDLSHTEWGSAEVGSDVRGYWHEISLGYPYPDGYACKSTGTLNPDDEQYGGDFMYFELGRWKAEADPGWTTHYRYVSSPEIRVFKLKSRCPATGGWTTSYDAYEGVATPGMSEPWKTTASRSAGVNSDNRNGFVGQYFAPSDAKTTFMVNYPNLDDVASKFLFSELIRNEADQEACMMHLYSYDAESTLYTEEYLRDLKTSTPFVWNQSDGHSFLINSYYDTDYEYVNGIQHDLSWGSGGRDYYALCESQETSTASNDPEDSGGFTTTSTSRCSVTQDVPILRRAVDTCVPGSAVFSVGPATFTPEGGKVPILKEMISGQLGASARVYASDISVYQGVVVNGEREIVHLGEMSVTTEDGAPLDLPFYSAYFDGEGEGVVRWDCSMETESRPFVGEKHVVRDVFQRQSIIVREIELGSSEDMISAVAFWMPHRRDHVALPVRNGVASFTTEDGFTFKWDTETNKLGVYSEGFEQVWFAQ